MTTETLERQITQASNDPAWERIQALSDELIATAELGDWTRMLSLENEWLNSIKQFIISHQTKKQAKKEAVSVDYLDNILDINQELYQQCAVSKSRLTRDINATRACNSEFKKVKVG